MAQAVRRSPPTAGSRVRVSVTPCGFRGGRNGVWVGFSRGFSRFPLPQIAFHHFSILVSSISFHFISPCDGASGMVGRHPCYSRTYNLGASSHLIPRPELVLDTSWGYLFYVIARKLFWTKKNKFMLPASNKKKSLLLKSVTMCEETTKKGLRRVTIWLQVWQTSWWIVTRLSSHSGDSRWQPPEL